MTSHKKKFDTIDAILIFLSILVYIVLFAVILIMFKTGTFMFSQDVLPPPDYIDTIPTFKNLTYKKE